MGMPPDLNIVVFVKQEHFEAFRMKKLPLLYNIAAAAGDIYEVHVSSFPSRSSNSGKYQDFLLFEDSSPFVIGLF